jgi:pimeloyl-ACP methyl ester carboxylesterase
METVTSKDGTTIAFDVTGDGPPLVIVAGATSTRRPNAALADLLSSQHRVLNYDRRGRGDSGDTPPYAVDREIEDLAAAIEAAGGGATVLGLSSGANLSLRAAAAGLDIARLALWEPNFIVNDARPPLPDDYVDHIDELVAADRRRDAVEYFMTAAVGMPAEFVAPMRRMPIWPAMEAIAHTIAYDGRIVGDSMSGNPISPQRFAGVSVPALVLVGGTTPWLTDGGHALAEALPRGRIQRLDGQTHDVAANVLAPAVLEFTR